MMIKIILQTRTTNLKAMARFPHTYDNEEYLEIFEIVEMTQYSSGYFYFFLNSG